MITPCIFRKIDQLQGPKDAHEAEPTTLNRAHSNRPLSPVMLNMQPLLLPWLGQGVWSTVVAVATLGTAFSCWPWLVELQRASQVAQRGLP